MKILFIAPLPPPVTGHSLVSQALLDDLERDCEMAVVDFNKESFVEGADSAKRIVEVLGILGQVWRRQRGAARIYLTISESLMGNLKDLVIYLLCFRKLARMYIHLHGGSIKRLLWDHHRVLFQINRLFIRRMGGVIISGRSHLTIFEGLLPPDRVHILPNFAPDYLFATEPEINGKFSRTDPLRIIYISNFILKKGYKDLVDAFFGLDDSLKEKVRIDFAGRFDTPSQQATFLEWIAGIEQLQYHGVVDDAEKRDLFVQAHVFCLPTAFFEGQPVSILEAYAAGCVVVTTGQSGIRDVFTDGIHGFEVEAMSPASIGAVIARMVEDRDRLVEIALSNNRTARAKYRSAIYTAAVRRVILPPDDGVGPAIVPSEGTNYQGTHV